MTQMNDCRVTASQRAKLQVRLHELSPTPGSHQGQGMPRKGQRPSDSEVQVGCKHDTKRIRGPGDGSTGHGSGGSQCCRLMEGMPHLDTKHKRHRVLGVPTSTNTYTRMGHGNIRMLPTALGGTTRTACGLTVRSPECKGLSMDVHGFYLHAPHTSSMLPGLLL